MSGTIRVIKKGPSEKKTISESERAEEKKFAETASKKVPLTRTKTETKRDVWNRPENGLS